MSILSLAEQANPWWRDPVARPPALQPRRRALQRAIREQLLAEPRRATVLRGPRQVGKTTILNQCVDDLLSEGYPPANITYFDFSDERFPVGSSSPRDLAEHRPPGLDETRPRFLLLDEITRALGWDRWLKQVVDARTHRILATDSAASFLRDGATESGVGRWDVVELEGLTYREFLEIQAREGEDALAVERRIPAAFERYLTHGGFPEHVEDDSLIRVWSRLRDDISGKAIRKDLLAVRAVDTERVNHLFQYLVESSGAIFDTAKAAAALGSAPDRRSISVWVSLLEGTMLIRRLERRAGSAASRLKSRAHPRYYAADHGLVIAFAPMADPHRDAHVRGRAFECVVYRLLRDVERAGSQVSFHRGQRGGDEIDFVLDSPANRLVAIEVKHSLVASDDDVDALRVRSKKIGAHAAILIYGGPRSEQRDGVMLTPLRDFALDPGRYLEA